MTPSVFSTAAPSLISPSTRARSQCFASPSTVTHAHWLYRRVNVVNLICSGTAGLPFATIASIRLFSSSFAAFS